MVSDIGTVAIEADGMGGESIYGLQVSGNLIEMNSYKYGIKLNNVQDSTFVGNGLADSGQNAAYGSDYYLTNCSGNTIIVGAGSPVGQIITGDASSVKSTLVLGDRSGGLNVADGNAYMYNGTNILSASTTLNNLFVGPVGNLTMTGGNNTANGFGSLYFNSTGNNNTANGSNSLRENTTGNDNTANGYRSLYLNTTGNDNTANGSGSLYLNTTGFNNTANGVNSLFYNTTGTSNTANGYYSLFANTTGFDSTALGSTALLHNTTGYYNTALGDSSLSANTTGINNTASGVWALASNTTGSNNTASGYNSLFNNTSATSTVAVGYQAGRGSDLYYNQGSTYIGYQAGYSAETGSDYNTFLGSGAGIAVTTGSYNLILGTGSWGTGITTGSNNILLGQGVNAELSPTGSNQLNIGNLIFGTGLGNNGTLATGNIGIGTSSPDVLLSVGSASASGNVAHFENSTGSCYINPTTTSLSCSSDARLKTNVLPLDSADGLAAVLKLNPVTYNWKTESATTSPHTGFIAQDVQPVLPDLVSQGPDGYYTLNYAGLTPYLVKAVQEIATLSDTFKTNLIAWLGSASNGLTDLFAGTGHFNKLCVTDSPSELLPSLPHQVRNLRGLLSQSAASNPSIFVTSSGTSQASNSGNPGNANSTPPVISINGANPATITVGSTYADLGATITAPQADLNLGITLVVDNATSTDGTVRIDTSTPGTHTILYTVTDPNGLTGTITRTVIVSPVQQTPPPANDNTTSPPAANDNSGSGTATGTNGQ